MSGDEGGALEPVRVVDLTAARARAASGETPGGRTARTLAKEGPLRVVLVVLAAGGELAEHQAPGPITVQPLAGRLRFRALGHEREIGPGDLLIAAAGVRHAVTSAEGATFLLTVVGGGSE